MKFMSLPLQKDGSLLTLEMAEDPYPVYAELREKDPVHFDTSLNAWILTRYDDIIKVLKADNVSIDRVTPVRSKFSDRFAPVFDDLSAVLSQMDGPDHARIRNLVHEAFTKASVEGYSKWISDLSEELLDKCLRQQNEVDLIRDFAVPLPIMVMSEIIGFPEDMRTTIKRWSDEYAAISINFYTHVDESAMEIGMKAIAEFRAYILERIEQIRMVPEQNLLSAMVAAEKDNQTLSDNEILANTILIFAAGIETTTPVLGNGIRLLHDFPEQAALLKNNPDLLPNAAEEIMRFAGPIQFVGRFATEEIEIGGKKIAEGDLLIMVIASGSRDPEKFDNPEVFDVRREHIHHLAFSSGQHMCAGLQLARLEIRLALAAYLERIDRFELKESEFTMFPNFNIHGYSKLLATPVEIAR